MLVNVMYSVIFTLTAAFLYRLVNVMIIFILASGHFETCILGRFTFTKVVRIIMDVGLSVALMSEKEKFEVSSSYSIGKHPNLPRPFFSCVFIQVKSIKV